MYSTCFLQYEIAIPSGANLYEALGGIMCNFTQILPYFQHWEMKLDHDCFHVSKLSEDQKKDDHRKLKSICPRNHMKSKKGPNIIQRSDADHSPIIGGDADISGQVNAKR